MQAATTFLFGMSQIDCNYILQGCIYDNLIILSNTDEVISKSMVKYKMYMLQTMRKLCVSNVPVQSSVC